MLSFGNRRFVSDKAVIQSLTEKDTLPAKLQLEVAQKLGLSADGVIESLTKAVTKGVGGTQCRPYIITLRDGQKLFLKLSPLTKNSIVEQTRADSIIKSVLGSGDAHPFVCMKPDTGMRVQEGATRNEMLFFPFVPGDNLFITTTYRNTKQSDALSQFAAIGKCLAAMHIQCMQLSDSYGKFIETGCALSKVLIHDDWQSTNLMITPSNEALIIDTEGTTFSDINPYRNIAESWDLSGKDPVLMNVLIDAYVNEFSPELQEQVRLNVTDSLLKQHGLDVENLPARASSSVPF